MDVVRVTVVLYPNKRGRGEEICRTSGRETRERHELLRPDRRVFEKQESGPENSRSGAR